MFSGIVSHIGTVEKHESSSSEARLRVQSAIFNDVALGDSVAVNGVCLTVCEIHDVECVSFDISTETLRRTSLGFLSERSMLNLERSLRFGDRLDGHLVQGHVDAIGTISALAVEKGTHRFEITFPEELQAYIAEKGSVTVDGVSLTVGEVSMNTFSVYIIPYTIQHTIILSYRVGTKVNLEVDCIARYVSQALQVYLKK